MMDAFIKFASFCLGFIPANIRIGVLIVSFVGTILLLAFLGFKKGLRWSAVLWLFVYLFFLISMTIVFRELPRARNYNLAPLGLFRAILEGDDVFLTQAIMNLAAFIPLGLFLGCIYGKIKWWKVLLIGVTLSVIIEIIQFVLQRGFAECDDVLHNALGCMIGYGLYVGIAFLMRSIREKRRARI